MSRVERSCVPELTQEHKSAVSVDHFVSRGGLLLLLGGCCQIRTCITQKKFCAPPLVLVVFFISVDETDPPQNKKAW